MPAAFLVLLLLSVACLGAAPPSSSPTPVPDVSTTQSGASTHDLRVGASVTLANPGVTLTFVRVAEDSRCPTGVTCIWEGDATVELRAQPSSGPSSTLELHTSDRFAREGSAHGLTVRLERLTPLPSAGGPVPPDGYLVTLGVRR